MVAYGFKAQFEMPIVTGRKRQTVRAKGKRRHARPGEQLQLYTGLRAKKARKLMADPICTSVAEICVDVRTDWDGFIRAISIDGTYLTSDEMEAFARADGFTNLHQMGDFWFDSHGEGVFDGVVIHWSGQ